MNIIPLIGLLTALTVALLAWQLLGRSRWLQSAAHRQLSEMHSVEEIAALADPSAGSGQVLPPGSLEYKLMAAGVHADSPVQLFWLATIGSGLGAFILASALGLPFLPAALLAAAASYGPTAWLNERVKGRGLEIDRLLPTALGRIAAGLQANPDLRTALETVADSLDVEGPNPLSPELRLAAREIGDANVGREQALRRLAQRSPSISLANAAQLFESFLQAGGGEYANVLLQIATKVQQILVARNRAVAKAGDALLSAKVIPAVLLFVLFILNQDPLTRATLSAGLVQLVLTVAAGAMFLGYGVMRSMVREAA